MFHIFESRTLGRSSSLYMIDILNVKVKILKLTPED